MIFTKNRRAICGLVFVIKIVDNCQKILPGHFNEVLS
jgi:hypothetical protein